MTRYSERGVGSFVSWTGCATSGKAPNPKSSRPTRQPEPRGSVRTRARKYRLEADTWSRGFQDGQHGRSPPEVEQSAAIGGHMLMMAGARAEEVAKLVVSPAEPG